MMKRVLPILCVAALAGCTQMQQAASKVEPTLEAACSAAMALAPIAGPIAPYIIGGCGSAQAIVKLAGDPSSVQWVGELVGMVKAVRGA